MKNSEQYAPPGAVDFYPVVLDRIKTYASSLCRANNNNPVVNISTTEIYDSDTLIPTCSLSGKVRKTQSGSMSIALSFAGI